MTKRGGKARESQSLNSIRLEDFPENEELASSYFDWEYDSGADLYDDDEENVVVMKKADFLAEEDFLEKSMKMLDDEEDLDSDEKNEGLEDFTLKLDPSYFDLSESEMEAAASLKNSVISASAPEVFELEDDGEDDFELAAAEVDDMKSRSNKTEKPVSHSSVARLFAQESEESEKTAKAAKPSSADKPVARSSSSERPASSRSATAKTASGRTSSGRTSASGKSSSGQSGSSARKAPSVKSVKADPKPARSTSDRNTSSATKSAGRSLNSKTQISRSPSPRSSSGGGTRTGSSSASRSSSGQSRTSSSGSRNRTNTRQKKKTPIGLKIAKFFIFLMLWIAVGVVCYKGYQFAYNVFYDVPVDATDVTKIEFTVTGKETDEEMGEKLKNLGLIDDLKVFGLRCKLYKSDYVPGTYKLSRSYNTEKILNILAAYNYSTGTMEEPETTEASSEESQESESAENGEGGEEGQEGGEDDE